MSKKADVLCRSCNGSGLTMYYTKLCPVCQGKGLVRIPAESINRPGVITGLTHS